jgi:hypothetical protein
MHTPEFTAGDLVRWSEDAPQTWHHIYTQGPMVVMHHYWHSGVPTPYALKFDAETGMNFTPGFIYEVGYLADAAKWPFKRTLSMLAHEKWLVNSDW